MNKMKFRCSSLALIMSDAKSVDESLITPEIAKVIASRPRKDEDKAEKDAILAPLLEQSLSAGAKTYLEATAKEFIYGFNELVTGKYFDKGIIVEDQSIELYNSVFFTDYKKNTERRTNAWITGEPDIVDPPVKGIDIKSAWCLTTFPATSIAGADKTYEWQCRGYMMLWELPRWDVAYCLVNTPDELIKYEQEDLHYVDHLPEHMRVTLVKYERDLALEERIKVKCDVANKYLDAIVAQIQLDHTH